jgi:hypothetical protein
MGRIARNLIGIATVVVWLLAAVWLVLAAHPVVGAVVGALGLFRAWVLVRDWSKAAKR